MTQIVRRYGWRKDTKITPGELTHDRYGSSKPLPSKFLELADLVGGATPAALPMLDQGQTQRCVMYSMAEVVYGRLASIGVKPRLINIREGYVEAQRWEQNRKSGRAPLVDEGLEPVDAVEMGESWGVTSLADTKLATIVNELADARVNEDVSVADYQSAASHEVTGWKRIADDADSEQIIVEAKQMLVARFPGMSGTDLDAGFDSYSGGVYDRVPGAKSVGDHMTSLWGFDDAEGPSGAFLGCNHRGRGWGRSGWFWISYSTYASSYVSDRYFLDADAKGAA